MGPELLTVIVTSVSCVACCLVILMLVIVLYRKEPLCCRFRGHTTEHYTDDLPYHSRSSLMGITYTEHREHNATVHQGAVRPELPGRMFIIGKPSDYHLERPLPRLPSYDSVRKQDRRRQFHTMIAQRFGLNGYNDEPPPTYEETFHRSFDRSPVNVQFLDVHLPTNFQEESSNSGDTRNLS